jgi:hypothetical protein
LDVEVANDVEQDILRPERCPALPPARNLYVSPVGATVAVWTWRNADLVDSPGRLFQCSASKGVTELGALWGQCPNLTRGEYQSRSDMSAVDQGEVEYQKGSRAFTVSSLNNIPGSRQPVGGIVDRALEQRDPPVNITHAVELEFDVLQC